MYNYQIRRCFGTKENAVAPITDELMAAGYKQKAGGYVAYAKKCNIEEPSQYWHLIHSWSDRSEEKAPFNRSIQCGELLFWMAEVTNAVSDEELLALKYLIIEKYLDNRREGNRIIQNVVFDRIARIVEKY